MRLRMIPSPRYPPANGNHQRPSCVPPLESIEIDLLLDAIHKRYGYDFRSYARIPIERRIRQFLSGTPHGSIAELIPSVLHDRDFFSRLLWSLSITVTEMFRDPFFYRAVREQVLPLLRTWPHIKIWHAGCASGEEVYSLAIILKEEGLLKRTLIYATDISCEVLERAREGIYEARALRQATLYHYQAGGKASLSEYYHARYNAAVMDGRLREHIVFSSHNLAVDGIFSEMHLIFCRNVLIYFNNELQNRVLRLFTESLVPGGFLCIGSHEDIRFSDVADQYAVVDQKARIYKKLYLMVEKPQSDGLNQRVSCHEKHTSDTGAQI